MLKFLEFILLKENYFYLTFLIFILLGRLFKKNLFQNKFLKLIFIIFSFSLLGIALLKTIVNYFIWLNNPLSKKLLPPYNSLAYFLRYSFQHYFFSVIITIVFAYFMRWVILKFNKKYEEIFFYNEEPYLAAIGILATRWPNCLFFLGLVLFCGIIFHLFIFLFYKGKSILFQYLLFRRVNNSFKKISLWQIKQRMSKQEEKEIEPDHQVIISLPEKSISLSERHYLRLSLISFWLPCALLVLIFSDIINKWPVIQYFMI